MHKHYTYIIVYAYEHISYDVSFSLHTLTCNTCFCLSPACKRGVYKIRMWLQRLPIQNDSDEKSNVFVFVLLKLSINYNEAVHHFSKEKFGYFNCIFLDAIGLHSLWSRTLWYWFKEFVHGG